MPFEIKFEMPPAGYALQAKPKGETTALISRWGFVSSEDGDLLISRLEGFPSDVLSKIAASGRMLLPSSIDHMVAIIRKDGSATVYINELPFTGLVRPKRDVQKGEAVLVGDLADVQRMKVGNLSFPPDAGVMILFGVGWRRGFFYDFMPLGVDDAARDYDLEVLLGQYYCYLLRQDLFKITEQEWEQLLAQRWFPFVSLDPGIVKELLDHVRNGWNPDDLLDKVASEVKQVLCRQEKAWSRCEFFRSRDKVLHAAVERYLAGDFISAINNLYPQIEGVLRSCRFSQNPQGKVGQAELIRGGIAYGDGLRHECSLLLPDKFYRFLEGVVFADFDPADPKTVSRHSLCHGVAPQDKLDLKEATLAFLVLDQIYYFLSGRETPTADQTSAIQVASSATATQEPPPLVRKKEPGRNARCPCGSGKKYKNCCMSKEG